MSDAVTRIARIEMPDGTPVWARISGADELEDPGGELSLTDVGFAERVEAQVESLQSLITGVARSLAVPLRAVRPDEVSVEFGIELTAKAGKVVGLLADGEAKAAITVTLTWNGGPPDPEPAADPTTPANRTAIPGPTTPADPTTSPGPTPAPTTTPAPTAPPHPAPTAPPHPAPTASPHPAPSTPPPPGPPASAPHAGASPGAPAHGGATDPSGGGGA